MPELIAHLGQVDIFGGKKTICVKVFNPQTHWRRWRSRGGRGLRPGLLREVLEFFPEQGGGDAWTRFQVRVSCVFGTQELRQTR